MINENDIVYGTIMKGNDGSVFKIIGGCTIKGEQCYTIMPIVASQVVLKDWILKNAEIVKDNPIGIPISF